MILPHTQPTALPTSLVDDKVRREEPPNRGSVAKQYMAPSTASSFTVCHTAAVTQRNSSIPTCGFLWRGF